MALFIHYPYHCCKAGRRDANKRGWEEVATLLISTTLTLTPEHITLSSPVTTKTE